MKRRSGGQPVKTRRRKTVTPKRRDAPKAVRGSSKPTHETEAARLTRERDEALQQQAATSEVLRIIRRSPADVQPVFDAIVVSAARLSGAIFSVLYLYDGDRMRVGATSNFNIEASSSNSADSTTKAARAFTSRRSSYIGARNRTRPRRAC